MRAIGIIRGSFDRMTGYGHNMDEKQWLRRFVFLETVAGEPPSIETVCSCQSYTSCRHKCWIVRKVAGMVQHQHLPRLPTEQSKPKSTSFFIPDPQSVIGSLQGCQAWWRACCGTCTRCGA